MSADHCEVAPLDTRDDIELFAASLSDRTKCGISFMLPELKELLQGDWYLSRAKGVLQTSQNRIVVADVEAEQRATVDFRFDVKRSEKNANGNCLANVGL